MATRGTISCCTLVENSQLYSRLLHPERVRSSNYATDESVPKLPGAAPQLSRTGLYAGFGTLGASVCGFCDARFGRSQSTVKSPSASVQVLLAFVVTPRGLPMVNTASAYLPSVALTAVLPLPNRSYDTPMRGVMSCKLIEVTASDE